jgi:hypothetical protein
MYLYNTMGKERLIPMDKSRGLFGSFAHWANPYSLQIGESMDPVTSIVTALHNLGFTAPVWMPSEESGDALRSHDELDT